MKTLFHQLKRFWQKFPLLLRAILIGLLISTIGVLSWSIIATIIPMPFGFFVMLLILFLYLAYFSGKWGHKKGREWRRTNFRKTKMPGKIWILTIVAALLIVLIEQSGLVITFRIIEFPAETFRQEYSFLNGILGWAGWLVVIMISMVAGISEETGFRGYMQLHLEKKFHPAIAISIVSVIFVLVHIHQAWSAPILFHIFMISALFGTLAYVSGSIIPGMIGHIIMDVFNFSFWWSSLFRQFNKSTIKTSGIDSSFLIWCAVFCLAMFSFILIMKLTWKVRRD